MTNLIPPQKAPPSSWKHEWAPFSWRRGIIGVIVGVVLCSSIVLLGASPWLFAAFRPGYSQVFAAAMEAFRRNGLSDEHHAF
jgi:hypothetical protein